MIKKISLLILGIFLIGIASAATYCCEKTTSGALCQNVNSVGLCDTSINPLTGQAYRAVSSFCEATSYCKLGTCINQQEGTCLTTPQTVCSNAGGFWSSSSQDKLAQCKLGCCLTGNQAAFVTLARCNSLASLYGLDVNYRADIQDELTCLQSANPDVKGACVYTDNSVTACQLTTKADCQTLQKTKADATFHEGFLCSAQNLSTICAPSSQTKCDGEKVYFVDTCGNLANVYDAHYASLSANKPADYLNYWSQIVDTAPCDDGNGNKDSSTCGDCNYYYGSMCSEKGSKSVSFGNNICKSLDCVNYKGPYSYSSTGYATAANYPKQGETWCATDNKNGGSAISPGASSFRLICYNGDVTTEECDSTREKICAENQTAKSGVCKVNMWEDCTSQTNSNDCTDSNLRDCMWIQYSKYRQGGTQTTTTSSTTRTSYGTSIIYTFSLLGAYDPANFFGDPEACSNNGGLSGLGGLFHGWFNTENCSYNAYSFSDQGLIDTSTSPNGACVPKYSPGFDTQADDTTVGGESCAQAQSTCIVTYAKRGVADTWHCVSNCVCLTQQWADSINGICNQLGDCGVKKNYIGQFGANNNANQLVSVVQAGNGSKR